MGLVCSLARGSSTYSPTLALSEASSLSCPRPRGCCLHQSLGIMENVPPAMNNDNLSPLEELRPKRNAKSSRQKRSPAFNARTNADHEDEDSPNESGLLTPPSSQTQEDDMDPARMLFSPPPEEILRSARGSVSSPAFPKSRRSCREKMSKPLPHLGVPCLGYSFSAGVIVSLTFPYSPDLARTFGSGST